MRDSNDVFELTTIPASRQGDKIGEITITLKFG